jgi:hypothetical protein
VRQACGDFVGRDLGLAVCFALGQEPIAAGQRLEHLHVVLDGARKDLPSGGILYVTAQTDTQTVYLYHADLLQSLDSDGLMTTAGTEDEMYQLAARLAVGVLILAQDDRFVEPILLAKDRARDLTPEQRELAIERAYKRTRMRGYSIGRDWIASPHVRRPHLALRWTGKGRTTPKLVPVKGCMVRRSDLLEVPTGYVIYDDETVSADSAKEAQPARQELV